MLMCCFPPVSKVFMWKRANSAICCGRFVTQDLEFLKNHHLGFFFSCFYICPFINFYLIKWGTSTAKLKCFIAMRKEITCKKLCRSKVKITDISMNSVCFSKGTCCIEKIKRVINTETQVKYKNAPWLLTPHVAVLWHCHFKTWKTEIKVLFDLKEKC